MLGALADGVDVAVVAAGKVVLDDNAVLYVEAGLLGQIDVGPDTGGNDNHVAFQRLAVLEGQPADGSAGEGRGDGLGQFAQVDVQAEAFQALLQHGPGGGIKLAVHQVIAQVGDVDFQAPLQQAPGRFQAQKPAADYRHLAGVGGVVNHGLAVFQGAEGEDAAAEKAVFVVHVVDGG